MQTVKMTTDMVDLARRAADRWYVSVGHAAVGPVNLDLLARGVEAGKVPPGAFVRHEQWKVWIPLSELAVIEGDVGEARRLSDDISADASSMDAVDGVIREETAGSWASPSQTGGLGAQPAESAEPAETPAWTGQREALTLLMTAAVARGTADAAVVHEIDEDGAVAVGAHGPCRWEVIGCRLPPLDPALVAASTGGTLVVPVDDAGSPDAAGSGVLARLCRVAGPVEGAVLIPVRTRDCLVAMLEVGRRTAFEAAEIGSLEALVQALVHKLEGERAARGVGGGAGGVRGAGGTPIVDWPPAVDP
jgi:hypothetical protein